MDSGVFPHEIRFFIWEMPKSKKKRKNKGVKEYEPYLIFGMPALIGLMLLAVFLKPIVQDFFSRTFIKFEFSTQENEPEQFSEEVAGVPAPVPLQGSFTEAFSGVGWRNPLNSTVYQDFKTLTISFPPAYELEETNVKMSEVGVLTSDISDIVKVGGQVFTARLGKVGERYEGYLNGTKLFTSQYPGEIILASDGSSKIFLLYSAYEGEAFEIGLDAEIINDYSSVFSPRVTENDAIDPDVFHKDGTWWIFSKNNTPKLLRVRDGVVSDLTKKILGEIQLPQAAGVAGLSAAPAPEENAIFIFFGGKTYRLRDLGFEKSGKLIWESLRLNAGDGEIIRGRFKRIEDNGSDIKYFLSNNGGKNWEEAKLGEFIEFEAKGGDFRWRAELYPSRSRYESPWVKIVGVEYYIIRK